MKKSSPRPMAAMRTPSSAASARGYDTDVGELGTQLSGGQTPAHRHRARLPEERADLLLDEPTASLDPESEREVQKALDELRRGPHDAGRRASPADHGQATASA